MRMIFRNNVNKRSVYFFTNQVRQVKKVGECSGRNVVHITVRMRMIFRNNINSRNVYFYLIGRSNWFVKINFFFFFTKQVLQVKNAGECIFFMKYSMENFM